MSDPQCTMPIMSGVKVGIGVACSTIDRIVDTCRVIRPSYLPKVGIPHTWIYWARLQRVSRGLYVRTGDQVSSRLLLANKYHRLTLGLRSALAAHGIAPWPLGGDWWVIGQKGHVPADAPPGDRFFRSSWPREDRALVDLDGTQVMAQSPIRALIDCVRFRRRLDEGLAEGLLAFTLMQRAVDVAALLKRAKELHALTPVRELLQRIEAYAPITRGSSESPPPSARVSRPA